MIYRLGDSRRLKLFKKGILMKNALSVVIAVLALLLVFGVVVKLYQVTVNSEAESARKILDNIMGKINLLEDGETNSFAIQGFSSENKWYLLGFDSEDGGDVRPEKCLSYVLEGKSCLCACRKVDGKSLRDSCQDDGFCRGVDKGGVLVRTRDFDDFRNSGAQEDRNIYRYHMNKSCIILPVNLFEIEIIKSDSEIALISSKTKEIDGIHYDKCGALIGNDFGVV